MHQSSYNIMIKFRNIVDQHFNNTIVKILDVGSLGVNGTYKDIFSDKNKYIYVGLDMQQGPNVDYIPKDTYLWKELEAESFDVIISGQTFEHIEFPWLIMEEMEKKLKINGLICLIAPSRGPEHKYPLDCWRFYPDGFGALAKWVGLKIMDVRTTWGASGFSDGSDQWGDTHIIMYKEAKKIPVKKADNIRRPVSTTLNKNNPLVSSKKAFYYTFERNEVIEAINKNNIDTNRILEIGCATGATGKKLKTSANVNYYVGVELSDSAAKIAGQYLDKVIVADIEKTDLQNDYKLKHNDFNLILALDILEHLNDPWDTLASVTEYLKSDGYVIASIPNVQNINIVSSLIKSKWKYEEAGILDATHLRFFTFEEIEKMFTGAGLHIEKVEYILNPRIDATQLKEKDNAINLEKFSIRNLSKEEVLKFFTYQYLIIAKKDETFKKDLVSIIILTFNQLKYTRECVDSIIKNTPEPHEIIFVDNGSTDGTIDWLNDLIKNNKNYKLILNNKNLGFSKGNNQGIEISKGEFILLLNNDVVVTKNWLSGMLECMNSAPDVGIVGPMTNFVSGPQKVVNADFGDINNLSDFAESFRDRNRYRRISIRRIVGFCMLIKRSLISKIGFLDESFGSGNFEDDDYCLRAVIEGYKNLIAGDVFVHHYGSRSFIGNNIDYKTSIEKNKKIFLDKWNSLDQKSSQGKKVLIMNIFEKISDLIHRNENEQALSFFNELVKYSNEKKYYYSFAEILINADQFELAIKILENIPEDNNETKKLELLAYCKETLGLYNESEEYLNKASSLSDSTFLLNLKGLILFRKGNDNEAEKIFKEVIEKDKSFGESYSNLGVVLWTRGQKKEALDLFEKAFILLPTTCDIAKNYHDAIIDMSAHTRAKKIAMDALAINSNDVKLKYLFQDIFAYN